MSTFGGYYKYYIHNDTLRSKLQNDICSFRRVIWLLTQRFKLLSFFNFITTCRPNRHQCNVSPMLGEKPKIRPLMKPKYGGGCPARNPVGNKQ